MLGANTSGYQTGHEFLGTGRYMLQFASRPPAAGGPVVDANEFTFYSGISNLDFEIGDGNPAAIAIRYHVAQHCTLSHMEIKVGQGRAGLEDVGNNASDLLIEGGDYGIISVRTSPAWQFLLMDSTIEGQRKAAIHTQEVGMTLVRDRIAHTPVAIEIAQGMVEQLYGRDLTLEDIRRTALVLGDAARAHHQVTLEHIVCRDVPILVEHGSGGLSQLATLHAPSAHYVEQRLAIGLVIGPDGRERGVTVEHKETISSAASVISDIPALPPMTQWANVHDLGVKGDGATDDTAALQAAIDSHRTLYLPTGSYRIKATLHLRPDSVLIGFNPSTTVITPPENDPAFTGEGDAVPLVESARGGNAILSGIGIDTGNVAPRAAGLVWMASPHSMVDDVNFAAGHGRIGANFRGPAAAASTAGRTRAATHRGIRAPWPEHCRDPVSQPLDTRRWRRHPARHLDIQHQRQGRPSRREHHHPHRRLPDVLRTSHAARDTVPSRVQLDYLRAADRGGKSRRRRLLHRRPPGRAQHHLRQSLYLSRLAQRQAQTQRRRIVRLHRHSL